MHVGAKNAVGRLVPPSEGNEVRRDEHQGLGLPHSTDEAGELFSLKEPAEGRG